MCSTHFLFNARTLFQACILLDQCLALCHSLDQLFRHLIELSFQLPNFILPGDYYTLSKIPICKLSSGTHQAIKASHKSSSSHNPKKSSDRYGNDEPEETC